MHSTLLALLLIAGTFLVAGCRTSNSVVKSDLVSLSESWYYWGKWTFLTRNSLVSGVAQDWCRDANDASIKGDWRYVSAAMLFAGYAEPGFDTLNMRSSIPDPRWLDNCKIGGPMVIWTGDVPLLFEGSRFVLSLFPDDKGHSQWSIYFTLSSPPGLESTRTIEEALSFLKGTHPDRSVRITEFVIFYPLPGCPFGSVKERHSPKGVGVMIEPGDWFERK
jgi:hypothetical protein